MIEHGGVRYWTLEDVAASIEARGLVAVDGSRRIRLQRARRWLKTNRVMPAATLTDGRHLVREVDVARVLDKS